MFSVEDQQSPIDCHVKTAFAAIRFSGQHPSQYDGTAVPTRRRARIVNARPRHVQAVPHCAVCANSLFRVHNATAGGGRKMHHRLALTLALASAALVAIAARADGPPTLDVTPSCAASVTSGSSGKRTQEACLTSEHSAFAQLRAQWPQYSSGAKSKCVGMATHGIAQSYVELLTCLDILKEASALRQDDLATGAVPAERDREFIKPDPQPRRTTVPARTTAARTPPKAAPPANSTLIGAILEFISQPFKQQ